MGRIQRVRRPVLLVHGTEDTTVAVSDVDAIHAERSGDQVCLKVIAGSHDEYVDADLELPMLLNFLPGIDGYRGNS